MTTPSHFPHVMKHLLQVCTYNQVYISFLSSSLPSTLSIHFLIFSSSEDSEYEKTPYWNSIPRWENVTEREFLTYRWQVSTLISSSSLPVFFSFIFFVFALFYSHLTVPCRYLTMCKESKCCILSWNQLFLIKFLQMPVTEVSLLFSHSSIVYPFFPPPSFSLPFLSSLPSSASFI